jgi:hypothetical protein
MKKCFPLLFASIWMVAIGMGMGALLVYEYTPGTDTCVPVHWPLQSKIPHVRGQPTLIMFAHPDCPCTRASIGELSVLMTHCQNKVKAYVVFLQPRGSSREWVHTDLWQSAQAIPGVIAQADAEGNEARLFQVTTSGHVVVYGADEKLCFSGGITPSRGHYGDNEGLSDIIKLLNHEPAAATETPVFGCSLLDPKSGCPTGSTTCGR